MRSFIKYHSGDKIREDEMSGARSTHDRWEMHTKFWLENLNGRPRRKWEYNIKLGLREIRWELDSSGSG